MRSTMAEKSQIPLVCPKCGAERIAEIMYGLPNFDSPSLHKKLDSGQVVLGGCVLMGSNPRWHCHDCKHKWGVFRIDPTILDCLERLAEVSQAETLEPNPSFERTR
jgi:transposase-like protein